MAPSFRERLPSGLKPISFQGLPDLGIHPFVILPGRQLTTTIGSTTTKVRSIKLPKYPFDVNNSKIQGYKPAGRLNFNSKPLTPPLTPTNGSFSPLSPDSSKMDLDEHRTFDMGSDLTNEVQTTDHNHSESQILIEHNGLDKPNQGGTNEMQTNHVSDGRARSIKRVIRYRPLKNYEIFDLHSSKFAIELRQQIQADSPEFAESKNYSQDSRIKFIKSIKEFVKASRKNNLLREVELVISDLETGLSNSTDRSIKKVII
ncbi:8978_t:CDS:2 [Racocetra fulgida]|uniref:8978_t:CDS:1 n=1 Tax=Racocetra fulgida TaxID=60492 RepID=A0A9N9FXG8_9GLOM|nr:8978_t:CDS:2 [Racocetra fulgida]